MSALVVLDVVLLVLALLAAGDALRQLQALHYPAHAAVLVLIVVGAFIDIVLAMHGRQVHGWAIAWHAGMAAAGVLALLYPPEAHRWERY